MSLPFSGRGYHNAHQEKCQNSSKKIQLVKKKDDTHGIECYICSKLLKSPSIYSYHLSTSHFADELMQASLVLLLLSFPTVRAITGVDLQSIIFCQQIAEISMRSPESERSKMLVAIQSEAQVIAGQTLHIFCKLFRHQQWLILLQHLGHHQTTHFLE